MNSGRIHRAVSDDDEVPKDVAEALARVFSDSLDGQAPPTTED